MSHLDNATDHHHHKPLSSTTTATRTTTKTKTSNTSFNEIDFFDDSEGSNSDEDQQQLSWRLDPEESLSDWTLVIEKELAGTIQEYHVHKNILAVGPRKSDYFASLFRRCSQMREFETSTSRITLHDDAADNIPHMLDFIYHLNNNNDNNHHTKNTSNHGTNHASSKSSFQCPVSMRYLAQYFGIKLLHKRVMEFVQTDMSMSNVHHYIQSAKEFSDEKMLSLALHLVIHNIEDLSPTTSSSSSSNDDILQTMDPQFLYQIISSPEIDTCNVSCHLSLLVASYCQRQLQCQKSHHHPDSSTIDQATFRKLTDRQFLPLIDKECAMTLLELEAAVALNETETDTTSTTNTTTTTPTCLQNRCIKVLSQNWKDIENSRVWTRAPLSVMGELLSKTVQTAQHDLQVMESTIQSKLDHQTKVWTAKLQAAADTVHDSFVQERTERISLEQELEITKCRLLECERELKEYKREWNRMVRVPVHHSFRDVKRCTYHHQSGNEPFDIALTNNHKMGQYGKLRPTAMPTIGDSAAAEDGYLFLTKSGHFSERWPVFYYTDR